MALDALPPLRWSLPPIHPSPDARTSVPLGRARLAQGIGSGEAFVGHAAVEDALHSGMAIERALEDHVARTVADQAQVGHGHHIAVAVGAGGLVAREMALVGIEPGPKPVPHPFGPALLVE